MLYDKAGNDINAWRVEIMEEAMKALQHRRQKFF